uniref:Rhabdomeric opsin2 n=1 Tax=Idiosepius paradoxus TaxID=294707 RepID=A0A0H5ANT7_IDIPA|nr:rhabdomeric opsin2 [Idiosepius paradoxus]
MLEGMGTSCTFDYLTRSPNNTSYVICLNIFAFFVPVSIISVCYVNIIRAMYKHKKDMENVFHMLSTNPRITRGKKLNVELKTARALAIAIVLFCAGWAPYAIMSLIAQFGDSSVISRFSTGIPGIAAKCMTCMNPFLYAISNPLFFRKIKEMLCFRSGTRNNLMNVELTETPCDSKDRLRTQPQEREDSSSTKHVEEQIAVYAPNLQTCLLLKPKETEKATNVILQEPTLDARRPDNV